MPLFESSPIPVDSLAMVAGINPLCFEPVIHSLRLFAGSDAKIGSTSYPSGVTELPSQNPEHSLRLIRLPFVPSLLPWDKLNLANSI